MGSEVFEQFRVRVQAVDHNAGLAREMASTVRAALRQIRSGKIDDPELIEEVLSGCEVMCGLRREGDAA